LKLIVTGGCGFIGSHFVDLCVEKNDDLIILDSLLTGKMENIIDSKKSGHIEFLNNDIRNLNEIKSKFIDVDAIVHFAAYTGVMESLEKPLEFTDVNVMGTLNLLEICREFNIPKFILASTGAVYGNQIAPFHETMIPDPLSPYAASKVAAENFCKSYGNIYDITATVLRFTNVYGPRKSFGPYANVIPKFVRSALHNSPVTIFGDGSQERDFVYVKDIAHACYSALEKGKNDIYNIGTGKNTSLTELINVLEETMNYKFKKNFVDSRLGESKFAYSSIKKAQDILSYNPKYTLKEGLLEYIEFEKNLVEN